MIGHLMYLCILFNVLRRILFGRSSYCKKTWNLKSFDFSPDSNFFESLKKYIRKVNKKTYYHPFCDNEIKKVKRNFFIKMKSK